MTEKLRNALRSSPELPVIVVYCEGPPDDRHDRYIIAAYQRHHTTPTDPATVGPGGWIELTHWNGVRLRRVKQGRYDTQPEPLRRPGAWLGYRFRCGRCPLDEKRSEDDRNVGDKIYTVFDTLWRHDVEPLEISVRGLLREIGR